MGFLSRAAIAVEKVRAWGALSIDALRELIPNIGENGRARQRLRLEWLREDKDRLFMSRLYAKIGAFGNTSLLQEVLAVSSIGK
jgi:hypothetical protein